MRRRLFFGGFVLLILIGVSVAWSERTPLLTWYYLRELSRATEDNRQTWIKRVTGLDSAAVPGLIGCLCQADARACANAAEALGQLAKSWQPGDPRWVDLAEKLAGAFSTRSPAGQLAIMEIQASLLGAAENGPALARLMPTVLRSLSQVSSQADAKVRRHALAQAINLMNWSTEKEVLDACGQITRICLGDEEPSIRLTAIRLAMRPELKSLKLVVPLLRDPDAEVRRGALLAVGLSPSLINTDELLPLLHDENAEVRHLCEEALRSRGLQEQHLKLARLMTDREPHARLQAMDLLRGANDLETEPLVWLRRFSHDPSPAVRAAVVRAAAEQSAGNFRDRVEQMAQDDPSPTVRQIAQHYLASPWGANPMPR